MLVLLGNLLRHLPFLHSSQSGELVVLPVGRAIGEELHRPHVILARLAGREPDVLRPALRDHRTRLHVPAEDRLDGRKQVLGVYALLRHALFVQIEVELLIVILPPRELRLDKHLLDTAVRKQHFLQFLGPGIEFIVIIAVHLDAIGACTLTDIIAEPLVLQAIHIPATPAQLVYLAY